MGTEKTRRRRRKGAWSAAAVVALGAVVSAVAAGTGGAGGSADPGWTETECGTYSGKGCAPASQRVDLEKPRFSNPTKITNPWFPISRLRSAVLLGKVDGQPFRSETTLLPQAGAVAWDGKRVKVLLSQYTAYRNGRIEEVAIDRYAQADDGAVWYFGEDVVDYRNGTVATTEGTWLAGREGPPAMIMPARPQVDDVFRPENVIGIVFEEVEITEVGKLLAGPRGRVAGGVVARELHLDGTSSDKVFAPGYGEFFSGHEGNVEALAVGVPADSVAGAAPAQLDSLATSASGMLGSVRADDWEAARATLRRMNDAWKSLRAKRQLPLIAARLDSSLQTLGRAVRARKPARAGQTAIDVAQSVLDLALRYRSPVEIDRARFELWCQQVLEHAAARDRAGVRGDVATLEWIRDRFASTLDRSQAADVDGRLRALRTAADAGQLAAAGDHAARLIGRLRLM